MEIDITFPGNQQVQTAVKGITILTDQPVSAGGDAAAPSPFDLFIASIGTCAGYYVQSFCRQRGIPMDGIRLVQRFEMDPEAHLIREFVIDIVLPDTFPEKYRNAVAKAAGQCTVKRHLQNPPAVTVRTV